MSVRASKAGAFGTVDEVVVVVYVGSLVAALEHILPGMVEEIVGAEVHIAVQQSPGAVRTGHVGGGDAVVASPSALAASHAAATAAHVAHHRACEVVESAVVGVVAVQDDAELSLLGEIAKECRSLVTPVGVCRVVGGNIPSGSGHDVAEGSLHHSGLDVQVDHLLLFTVVDAGELRLLALLVYDLQLVDYLGRDVLRSQLGIVEEEGLAVDGDLGDGLSVHGDGTILADFYAGKLLEEVLKHVVLGGLEGVGIVLQSIFLHHYGIAHGRYAGSVQHLLVGLHVYLAQIDVCLHLDGLLPGLVAEKFRLEEVGAALDLGNGDIAGIGAEVVIIGFLRPLSGKGNRRKRNRVAIGRIQQHRGHFILGSQSGGGKQAGQQYNHL